MYLIRVNDPADTNNYGTNTGTSTTSGTQFSDTASYVTAVYSTNTGTPIEQRNTYIIGISAVVSFNVHGDSVDEVGTGYIYGKWQYRENATAGAWIDLDTETRCEVPATGGGANGLLTVAGALPTQTTGTFWDFRLMLRIDTTASTMSGPFYLVGLTIGYQW